MKDLMLDKNIWQIFQLVFCPDGHLLSGPLRYASLKLYHSGPVLVVTSVQYKSMKGTDWSLWLGIVSVVKMTLNWHDTTRRTCKIFSAAVKVALLLFVGM